MMKKLFSFLIVFGCCSMLFAGNGDTSTVRVFDKLDMNHYGNFDTWTVFPSTAKKSQRIFTKFTLGCLSNGQCEWDYTLKIHVRQHTGSKDSTLKQAPSFVANGAIRDSISYNTDTTYSSVFNSVTKQADSVATTPIIIVKYEDMAHPLVPTDTMTVWHDGFYRYAYDSTGKKTDSSWYFSGNTLRLVYTPYYDVFEIITNYEIARMITPYAKFFNKSFQYEYLYDVTDFASLLHDSAEIRIAYEGYSYGFTGTLDFFFIEGTPAKEAYKVQSVYSGYFPFGNGADPIENYLTEKSFKVDGAADKTKLRITVSGHGGEQAENCAEFCAKNYYLKINRQQIAQQLIWRDNCGDNAIINQGGTWIYDRANWCPGERINTFEYPLSVSANDSLRVDIDMDPFQANGAAGYSYEVQLIYYKDNNVSLDAGIEQILSPTKDFWQSRFNPVCDNAKIRIRNFGKTTIKQVDFMYQAGTGTPSAWPWYGNLGTDSTVEVTFPWMNWNGDLSNKTFKVWINKVNNTTDENSANNIMISTFDLPQVLPQQFVIETRTNNNFGDNSYTIKNSYGAVKYTRTFTQANTLYRDTISLGYGCYTFYMNDDGGNGLSFWNPPVEGAGSLRFLGIPTVLLKSFNADFGNFVNFNFRVGTPVGVENLAPTRTEIQVYPQPASDKLYVKTEGPMGVSSSLADLNGKIIRTFSKQEMEAGVLPVEDLENGLYLLNWLGSDGSSVCKKVTIVK